MRISFAMDQDQRALEIGNLMIKHAMALMLVPKNASSAADILNTGSAALVDTGTKKLLITCEHVWREFQNRCKADLELGIAIGQGTNQACRAITDWPLLDESKRLDLSIIEPIGIRPLGESSRIFAPAATWPPERVQVGELIVTLGFPGKHKRLKNDDRDIQFNATVIIDTVVSVSDRQLVMVDEAQERVHKWHGDELADEPFSTGGMSGGPAFVYRDGRLEFAGVLYGGSNDERGIVFVTHASFITAHGKIDYSSVPMF